MKNITNTTLFALAAVLALAITVPAAHATSFVLAVDIGTEDNSRLIAMKGELVKQHEKSEDYDIVNATFIRGGDDLSLETVGEDGRLIKNPDLVLGGIMNVSEDRDTGEVRFIEFSVIYMNQTSGHMIREFNSSYHEFVKSDDDTGRWTSFSDAEQARYVILDHKHPNTPEGDREIPIVKSFLSLVGYYP